MELKLINGVIINICIFVLNRYFNRMGIQNIFYVVTGVEYLICYDDF